MPRFNYFLDTAAVTPQIGYSWYDKTRFIVQNCETGVCKVELTDGTPIGPTPGLNVTGNGNSVWCYFDPTPGRYDPELCVYYDSFKRTRLNSFPFAISPEGDICVKPFSNAFATIIPATGGEDIRMSNEDAQNVQLLSGRRWCWTVGYEFRATWDLPKQPAPNTFYQVRVAEDNVILMQRRPDGALILDGKLISPASDAYFGIDVKLIGDTYWVTWSPSQNDTHAEFLHFTKAQLAAMPPAIDPTPGLAYPTYSFKHPLLIVPFKDPNKIAGTEYRMDDSSLGLYTEADDPTNTIKEAESKDVRALIAHDAGTLWTPPNVLRKWDIPFVELYRLKPETLDQTVIRWRQQVTTLLNSWQHDCGIIIMFYCQGGVPPNELWTIQEVFDGLQHISDIVNISTRIKVIAPFAYDRLNGITAHHELETSFNALKAAAPSGVVLIPVEKPLPPQPIPGPVTPYPAASVYKTKG